MKIAVMQPYFFPYIGYYQLVNAVEIFVFYDDVNYIKKGFVDRNSILLNGQPFSFKVPCRSVSQNKRINEIEIDMDQFISWKNKFSKTLEAAYKKAPYYNEALELIMSVLDQNHLLISELAIKSIITTFEYLGLKTEFKSSSIQYTNSELDRADRLIDICKEENADDYINAAGGKRLYTKDYFRTRGINLYFIKSSTIEYPQYKNDFIAGLSMVDVLMFNNVRDIKNYLNQFELE